MLAVKFRLWVWKPTAAMPLKERPPVGRRLDREEDGEADRDREAVGEAREDREVGQADEPGGEPEGVGCEPHRPLEGDRQVGADSPGKRDLRGERVARDDRVEDPLGAERRGGD